MTRSLVLLALVACGGSQGAPTSGDEPEWLAGTWRVGDGPGGDFEVWGRDEGGGLVGLSVNADAAGLVTRPELMWIEPGARALVAMPGGHRTRFALAEGGPGSLRFEAPQHDSPKWIRYGLDGEALEASIGDDAQPTATWRFQRVPGDPMVHRTRVEVCRRGDAMEVTQTGCYCASLLACGVVDDPLPLRVAILDNSCDACEPAVGECPYEGTMQLSDGECATRDAITLLRADLR